MFSCEYAFIGVVFDVIDIVFDITDIVFDVINIAFDITDIVLDVTKRDKGEGLMGPGKYFHVAKTPELLKLKH